MAKNRPLSPDELGHKGERRFSEICTDAKLVCNQSERDRTGWDFLIEFPTDDQNTTDSLDKRPPPMSCHFQVKTIWTENDRIKLRLSAAERLAKETRPTFIYIFKAKADFSFPEAFVIHLVDDALSEILKALRKAQADGASKINDIFISLSAQKMGTKIAPTGEALKQLITQTCGTDRSTYAALKDKMLNEIGFDEPRIQAKFSVRYDKDEDLIDAFLGKGEIEATNFSIHEKRFGISLSQIPEHYSEGRITVQATPTDKCSVVFRSKISNDAARFDADIFSSPQIFSKIIGYKIIIRGDAFEIIHSKIKGTHNTKLNINTRNYFSKEISVSEWINYSTFLLILSRGNFSIKVSPKSTQLKQNTISCDEKIDVEEPEKIERLLKILHATKTIFQRASIYEKNVKIEDIIESRNSIAQIKEIIEGKAKINPFDIDLLEGADKHLANSNQFETIFISFAQIAKIPIGYSCETELFTEVDGNTAKLTSNKLSLIEIEELSDLADGFNSFSETQKLRSKSVGQMINYPIIPKPDQSLKIE